MMTIFVFIDFFLFEDVTKKKIHFEILLPFIEPKYAVGKNLKQYTCDKCHLIFDGKLKYRAHYKEVHNDTGHFFSDRINFELIIEHLIHFFN